MVRARDDEPIGSLIGSLVDDGRAYATATVEVYKQKALSWVPPVRIAVALIIVAILLCQAAITALLVGVGFWVARWVGPLGGGVVAAILGLAIAAILVKVAVGKLSGTPAGAKA